MLVKGGTGGGRMSYPQLYIELLTMKDKRAIVFYEGWLQ